MQESRYAVRARVVEFRLQKLKKVWWERLLREKARQHWLRVDFQNWKDEEDVGEESEPFEEVRKTTLSLILELNYKYDIDHPIIWLHDGEHFDQV